MHCPHQSVGIICSDCTADDIAALLAYYNRQYRAGSPEISDVAYDYIESRLRAANPEHPFLHKVG